MEQMEVGVTEMNETNVFADHLKVILLLGSLKFRERLKFVWALLLGQTVILQTPVVASCTISETVYRSKVSP